MSKYLANFHFGVNYPFKDLQLQFTSVTIRAVTIHQTHDSVPRFGSYHDFFVGGGRKKKKDF